MDELARDDRHGEPDLAAIVLGSNHEGRRITAPERVPIDDRERSTQVSYDLRSAAILAVVVAVLATLIGWTTTIDGTDAPLTSKTGTEQEGAAADDAASPTPASKVAAGTAADATVSAGDGPDLRIGRISGAPSAAGGAVVTVGIGNVGSVASPEHRNGIVQLVVGGDMVVTEPLPGIEPTDARRVTFTLDTCPAEAVALTAIIDAGAVIREIDERNNATSRVLAFAC